MLNRYDALDEIDAIRETLSYADQENGILVSIVRDLWDNYPVAVAQRAATHLRLANRTAEATIKRIVAEIAP